MTKPDILPTIQAEGVEGKQSGRHLKALCPLHQEKTPSFNVDPEKQLWHCFGCGKGGDVIQFIMELKNFSFKDACNYLHLEKSRPLVYQEVLKKKQLIESFKLWCKSRKNELCDELRTLNRKVLSIETHENLKKCAPLFSVITDINYCLDILQGEDEELKFNFYLEEKRKRV
jgi:hypothetical protein